jgi:hypothetical protein
MQQQEIRFFWPLTEQEELALDFTPCKEYDEQKRKEWMTSSVSITAGTGLTLAAGANGTVAWAAVDPSYQNFQVLPDGAVGSWQVTPNMSVGRKTKPNYIHRLFTKLTLGWEWKDK